MIGGRYDPDASRLRFVSATTKPLLLGGLALALAGVVSLGLWKIHTLPLPLTVFDVLLYADGILVLVAFISFAMAASLRILLNDAWRIVEKVRRGLYCPERGNPFHLRAGELLPEIRCKEVADGLFHLVISTHQGVAAETIIKAIPSISAALNGRFTHYAVVSHRVDPAGNFVRFILDDVAVDRSLTFSTVEEMRPAKPTLLRVDTITDIDLTASAHMLIAAKTRSGKTTGCLALVLQILLAGPDRYGSDVVIVDGKRGELSQAPGVVSFSEDGDGHAMLDAMRAFADNIIRRQAVLNELARERGDAAMWWNADMRVCVLFVDEYVQIRAALPAKASKDDPDYCVATFDKLLQRIITTGASAGCYVMLSMAEASVENGGLPAMLRSAMSTRVLFRPTLSEAKLLWSADKLEGMVEGEYKPGDAWFTTTDGKHEEITPVHFPRIEFPAYAALRRLLEDYHAQATQPQCPTPPAGEAEAGGVSEEH